MDSASHQKQALTVSQAENQTHNYPQPIFTTMVHCAHFQVDSVNRQKQTDSINRLDYHLDTHTKCRFVTHRDHI